MPSYLASYSVGEQPEFQLCPCPTHSLGTCNMCSLPGSSNTMLLKDNKAICRIFLICRIFPTQDTVYVTLQVPTEPASKLCGVFNTSAKPFYTVIFQSQTKTLIWAESRTFPHPKNWTLQKQCETAVIHILLWHKIPASLRNAPISRHNTIQFFN